MSFDRTRVPARGARELLTAAFAAGLLLLAFGLPVLAGQPPGPTKLLDPEVTPRTADTATPVTFTVTYWNAHDLPPDYVRVVVAGVTWPMTGAGSDWKAGVAFTVTTVLPAGTHDVLFEARDAEKFVDVGDGGTVAIGQAPAPPPPPAPGPAPTPTPVNPPPAPAPAPPSGGGSSGSGGSGGSGGTSGGSGTSAGSGGAGNGSGASATGSGSTSGEIGGYGAGLTGGSLDASGDAAGDAILGGANNYEASRGLSALVEWPGSLGGEWGAGATGGASAPSGSGSPATSSAIGAGDEWPTSPATVSASGSAATGGSGSGLGPVAWLQQTFGVGLASVGLSSGGGLPTLPAVVSSTVLVGTWMAFVLFNKRRRDEEPPAPDGVLQASAAMGIGMGAVLAPAPVAPVDPEALMPRWRRPSLLEARKTDPIRAPAPERPRMTFAHTLADVGTGGERRAIRYAVIPLLDRPDEIQAMRLGELAAGDEVEVQQRSGAYCHVICPDGREGWVHRTTLGDVIAAPRTTGGRTIESDPEPEAENALAALLAARGLK